MQKELKKRKNELKQAGLNLQDYMKNNDLVSVDAQTSAMITRSASLVQRRQDAQNNLITTKAAIAKYNEQLNRIKPGLAKQFSKAIGPKMSRLRFQLSELNTRKIQLLTNYPGLKKNEAASPELQKINRKIDDFKSRIQQLTKKLLKNNEEYLGLIGGSSSIIQEIININQKLVGLQVKQQQYQSLVNVLTGKINKLNAKFSGMPANIMRYARLKQAVALKQQQYLGVSKQYANMKLWQQTQFGPGRLLDTGTLPGSPIEPKTRRILFFGLIVGGFFGLGFVFVREVFSTKIDGLSKLEQFDDGPGQYKAPLLAAIPDVEKIIGSEYEGSDYTEVKGKKVSTRLLSHLKATSPFAESFRELETGVMHTNPDDRLKTVAITSTKMGEGKTVISSNLGVVMAEAGHNVIVVDTDFRRHKIHRMFGISRAPGISDILFDNLSLRETIKPTVVPNLSVLTTGTRTPNPATVVKSDAFFLLLKELEKMYDIVIIDTQPFGIISDSLRIMDYVDGVVVVTRFQKTHTMDLQHTLGKLHKADANVIGMVLNGFIPSKSRDYYGGNYHYYNKLYYEYKAYTKGKDS